MLDCINNTHCIISWLYRREIAADGFFSADHLKAASKHQNTDINLTRSAEYMANPEKYSEHIRTAKEYPEVCTQVSLALILTEDM